MDPELTALTSTAATAVVKLLATAAWEQATSAVGRLWHRVHPERVEIVQAELAEGRTEVLAAQQAGDEQAEQALVSEWQGRLRRLLAADRKTKPGTGERHHRLGGGGVAESGTGERDHQEVTR